MNMDAVRTMFADVYRKNAISFFLGLVVLMVILFYLMYQNAWAEAFVFNPLANIYAVISGKIIEGLGYGVNVSGDLIYSTEFSVSIKKGCDAAEPMAIFIAAIVAFPASIRNKFSGLVLGLSILFLLNIVRIISLYMLGIYAPDFFETMHLAIWQVVFIIVAIVLWYLWLRYVVNRTEVK